MSGVIKKQPSLLIGVFDVNGFKTPLMFVFRDFHVESYKQAYYDFISNWIKDNPYYDSAVINFVATHYFDGSFKRCPQKVVFDTIHVKDFIVDNKIDIKPVIQSEVTQNE